MNPIMARPLFAALKLYTSAPNSKPSNGLAWSPPRADETPGLDLDSPPINALHHDYHSSPSCNPSCVNEHKAKAVFGSLYIISQICTGQSVSRRAAAREEDFTSASYHTFTVPLLRV